MLGIHDFWLFVLSGLLLNITPGPDTLYIVGRSSTQGLKAGSVAALGIGTGTLVHVSAAALGLSAILAASASAFAAVKWLGAAYLIYVGIGMIRSAGAADVAVQARLKNDAAPVQPPGIRAIFLQGFFTNVLNPKVALFFLAFLPQFVAGDAPHKPWAFLLLGIIFDVNGTLWNLMVAWSTARLSTRLTPNAAFIKWFNRSVGSLFIYVGIRLALTQRA